MGRMNWGSILDTGVGIGVLLIGVGIFAAAIALAKLLARMRGTLDEVDRQLAGLGKPVEETLEHIEGISATADDTIAKLGKVVGALNALLPVILDIGATLSSVSAGLRRLITGKTAGGESEELVHHGK